MVDAVVRQNQSIQAQIFAAGGQIIPVRAAVGPRYDVNGLDYITDIIQEITGSVTNAQLATALAIKSYVDDRIGEYDSTNVDVTGGTITGVELNSLATALDVADGGTGLDALTQNGVAYASDTDTFTFATGTDGEILQISGTTPAFGGIDGGTY